MTGRRAAEPGFFASLADFEFVRFEPFAFFEATLRYRHFIHFVARERSVGGTTILSALAVFN